MKNLYKSLDIFCCVHEAHSRFKYNVSVFHILRRKKCFPEGCFYFRWKCKLLSKQKVCHRGFRYVGRKCAGCKYFYEEKVHNVPELKIDPAKYRHFLNELDEFEDWLNIHKLRELIFEGRVDGVKPLFVKKVYPKTAYISFRGYLVSFREIFLGNKRLEDYVYLVLSSRHYSRLQLGRGSRIEGRGILQVDEGRILLKKPRSIEILEAGEAPVWNDSAVAVARKTATEFPLQPEGCVRCPFGALVDVEKNGHSENGRRKELICLKGIADYRNCHVPAEYCGLEQESRPEL
ncbi:MAG: hypothetical protein Kow0037_25830 [Calditrichia bacterium]